MCRDCDRDGLLRLRETLLRIFKECEHTEGDMDTCPVCIAGLALEKMKKEE